ncbi:hypothetical protein ACHAWF_013465 [Thalassiosira exigua]
MASSASDGASKGQNGASKDRGDDDAIHKERAKSAFRYAESIGPGLELEMDLTAIHHASVSEFQEVQVIDSYFGRTLVTDGKTQSAEHDEFLYHETLVHPPLFWCAMLGGEGGGETKRKRGGAPRSVFIGGGGELATAREVLRHDTIERVVMVDIDAEVMEVCKKYMPEWGGEAVANHPKMDLIVGDAHKYIMETDEKFDVMILDISDPIEAGPGIALYTQEFYRRASEVLTKNGVFVTQAGSAAIVPHPHHCDGVEGGSSCFGPIRNTLATAFDHAVPYATSLPSFGEDWGFVMAFNGPKDAAERLRNADPKLIDAMIEERIGTVPGVPEHRFRAVGVTRATRGDERGGEVLKHYDGVVHRGLFTLSKALRGSMRSDERIMTMDDPIFMY